MSASNYQRLERLGKGSFGSVFRGLSTTTGEVVAIKVLDLEASDEDLMEIQKEISVLRALDCPYITRYHCSFVSDMSLWIVMDYAGGGSVRGIMKIVQRIQERYIVSITKGVLLALIYLHANNIIHRDIKAANILLTDDGNVKLCDFGVAGQVSMNNLKRNSFVGTPYWMAPEVIRRSTYDFKADIWSLGITVYEMATGNPPLADQEPMRAVFMIPRNPPARLSDEYPRAVKEFVAQTLNDDPVERPTAEDLLKTRLLKQKPGDLIELVNIYKEKHANSDDEFDLEKELTVASEWDFETMRKRETDMQTIVELATAKSPKPTIPDFNQPEDEEDEELNMETIKSPKTIPKEQVEDKEGDEIKSLNSSNEESPLTKPLINTVSELSELILEERPKVEEDEHKDTTRDEDEEENIPLKTLITQRLSERAETDGDTSTDEPQTLPTPPVRRKQPSKSLLAPALSQYEKDSNASSQISSFSASAAPTINMKPYTTPLNPIYQRSNKPPRIDKTGWNRSKMHSDFVKAIDTTLIWLDELETLSTSQLMQ